MIEAILEYFSLTKIKKKIVCLDFDGVIHSYRKKWINARTIPDPPVLGAIEWINSFINVYCTLPYSITLFTNKLREGDYELCIYSSRSKYFGGILAMKKYLIDNGLDHRLLEVIKFPKKKPAAYITIDDRVICFDGIYKDLNSKIDKFEPWNKRGI